MHPLRLSTRALAPLLGLILCLSNGCANDDGAPGQASDEAGDGVTRDGTDPPDTAVISDGTIDTAVDTTQPEITAPDTGPCADGGCDCTVDADCASRGDGDLCAGVWTCDLTTHTCQLDTGAAVTCPPATACAKHNCDPGTGTCSTIPRPDGTECADGNVCTTGDACKTGSCVSGADACGCKTQNDCTALDDGNPCNGTLFCDKATLPWTCRTNPGTVLKCDSSDDTAYRKTTCNPTSALCVAVDLPTSATCEWDGNSCTADHCKSGSCAPGKLVAGNPACACKSHADCDAFEDGNACNGTLYCNKVTFACTLNPATIVTCPGSADSACSANTCDPALGACKLKSILDGTKCDDGTPCTAQERCDGGDCVAAELTCSCTETADCGAVDDKNACNGTLYCDLGKGRCVTNPATVVSCDQPEKLGCSVPTCEPASGECKPAPAPDLQICEADGTPCTGVDRCQGGTCVAGPLLCGCAADADCAKLDVAGPCDGTLFCDKGKGVCVLNTATKIQCDGGEACKPNTCDPKTGTCALLDALDGTGCDTDGFVCTADACASGACKAGPNKCLCNEDAECAAFEDGDACDGTLRCDNAANPGICVVDAATIVTCSQDGAGACVAKICNPKTGACIAAPTDQGKACDDGKQCTTDDLCNLGLCAGDDAQTGTGCADGSVCTIGDTCKDGACLPGSATECDDATACTIDTCDAAKGCVFTPDDTPCDDGVACTLDSCYPGHAAQDNKGCAHLAVDAKCSGGGACGVPRCAVDSGCVVEADVTKCADGVACTVEACDLEKGCSVVADDKLCDDGVACTKDTCNEAAGCVHNADSAACNDGSSCTVDSCAGAKGCVFAADDKLACSDGDVCTGGDSCKNGACATSSKQDCDDGRLCTTDTCGAASGCSHLPNQATCTDGDLCTDGDTCKDGACGPGELADCDDKLVCTTDSCDPKTGCYHAPRDVVCDDGNPCTDGVCDLAKGCTFPPKQAGHSIPCYSGLAGTKDVGVCQPGAASCDGNGSAGGCVGDVVPSSSDPCGGGDENCNGQIDEDCVNAVIKLTCGGGQTGRPAQQLLNPFVITVTNTSGVPLSGVKVDWSSPDGGSFPAGSGTTTTDSKGITRNSLILGGVAGKAYTARAAVQSSAAKLDMTAAASASWPDYHANYTTYCDTSLLRVNGVAQLEASRVRIVDGGDGRLGSVWYKTAVKPNTSFEFKADVSGYTRGYSLTLQSTNSGTGLSANGYGDSNTPKTGFALVAYLNGGKGGGSYGAPTLTLALNGTTLKTVSSFLGTNQNQQAKTWWMTYDHPSKSLKIYIANRGAAQPASAKVTVTADVWKILGSNGKPTYVGFTAGNSSAGSNGTKYIEKWSLAYK